MKGLSIAASLALLVGFGAAYASTLGTGGMLVWDEAHYATLARALLGGRGYVNFAGKPEGLRPPLLPAASALAMGIAGRESDLVARTPVWVAALLCLLVVQRSVGRKEGLLAGVAAAVSFGSFPATWSATSKLLTEIPFMLFFSLAVVEFHRGQYENPRHFYGAWLCFALALLTRYTAVLFGPIVVVLVLLPVALRDREALARMRSRAFLLAPLLAAALLLPWLARYAWTFCDPLLGFRRAARQIPDYARHGHFPLHHYFVLLPSMLGGIGLVAAVGGAVHAVVTRHRLALAALSAGGVIVAWMSRYDWKEPRLITAALPFLAIPIGTGTAAALRALERRGLDPRAGVVGVALVLAVAFASAAATTRPQLERSLAVGYPSFLDAMTDLAARSRPDDFVLAANCHQVSWTTRLRCGGFREGAGQGPSRDVLDARLSVADWVVVTSFEPGQPRFLEGELAVLRPEDFTAGAARRFQDAAWWTVVVPADLLRARRSEAAAGGQTTPSEGGGAS